MKWNEHWNLEGKHAFLGASKWNWINYDRDTLITRYQNHLAVERGTRLHDLAARMISEGIKAQATKQTFNMYVNDAIKFNLKPETVLYFSNNAFGTADGIAYDEKRRFLRIHDLKTGTTPAHMEQLMIYAALFCLEYRMKPHDISMELRIYQNNDIIVCNLETDPELQDWIEDIMEKIVEDDKELNSLQNGE